MRYTICRRFDLSSLLWWILIDHFCFQLCILFKSFINLISKQIYPTYSQKKREFNDYRHWKGKRYWSLILLKRTFSSLTVVTNISLLLLVPLNALQLAAGATGLSSQGVTAVMFMGVLFVHWAQRVNLYTAGGVLAGLHLCQSCNALLWVPSRVLPQKDTNKQLFM